MGQPCLCAKADVGRNRILEAEDFFLYDEDADLQLSRGRAVGNVFTSQTRSVYHKGNATTGRLSDALVYFHTRNLEFVWIKNMPGGLMLRFIHHKVVRENRIVFLFVRPLGKWATFFKAKWDALKMAP